MTDIYDGDDDDDDDHIAIVYSPSTSLFLNPYLANVKNMVSSE